MSAELVGILSVGATLLVGGLATAGALVGLILRLDGRQNARMDTLEGRQYEIVQTVARLDATQQAMLATLARIEEHTRPAGDPPTQPVPFQTASTPADDPRQSAQASTTSPV